MCFVFERILQEKTEKRVDYMFKVSESLTTQMNQLYIDE